LGIVPARGGSKGIPRKNIRPLAGKPLLEYTANAALSATLLSRVWLSTEDLEIAEVGKAAGLEVPFFRPPELSEDSTPMVDVVLHAIRWAQENQQEYDAVCILQPTSPLRSSMTIDRSISLLWDRHVDSVVSVRPVPLECNPHWVFFETSDGLLRPSLGDAPPITRRQQLPPAYHLDGTIFVTRTQSVVNHHSLTGGRLLGMISAADESFDLDTQEQWQVLEERLNSVQELTKPRGSGRHR